MAFKQLDTAWIVFQGGPRWDGNQWVNGDSFTLSGRRKLDLGVELSPGVTGLDRAAVEYRFDTSSSVPGAVFVSEVAGGREVKAAVNILGDTPAETREFYRRWQRNNSVTSPGRLWIFTSDGEPRYLPVRPSESAGQGTHEKDFSLLTKIEEMEWGWVSDESDFLGYKSRLPMKRRGNEFVAKFYNPSTSERVYPSLFLPGGAEYDIDLGFGQGRYTTPFIPLGEEARVNLNPKNPTFLKKKANGEIVNLWPSMAGRRPKLYLEPETVNEWTIPFVGEPEGVPQIEYTPRFQSWV